MRASSSGDGCRNNIENNGGPRIAVEVLDDPKDIELNHLHSAERVNHVLHLFKPSPA
jgi:hypothetical protein